MSVKKAKTCTKCKKAKPFDAFCKGRSDYGMTAHCKACVAAYKRAQRRDPSQREKVTAAYKRDRESEARRRWYAKEVLSGRNAEKRRANGRAYYQKNKVKILAQTRVARKSPKRRHQQKCNMLVSLMVYFDMLAKGPCQVCGATEGRIEAAHRSYDDPLNIFWACSLHHRQYDKGWIDEHGKVLRNELGDPLTNGDTSLTF